MELLFVVEQCFELAPVGLVLAPGPVEPLPVGTPLFMVRPDGTHLTAIVRTLPTLDVPRLAHPVAVALGPGEVPQGTRVFGNPLRTP